MSEIEKTTPGPWTMFAHGNACSALKNGFCMNGFPTSPWCNPVQSPIRCFCCGRDSEKQPLPFCMREEWCGKTLETSGGKPSEATIEYLKRRAALSDAQGER